MKYTVQSGAFWLLFLLCFCTLVPFLGLPEYNTDAEPREAVVSYTMIVNDDWTLPRNNDGDMAFKPPFFHWCVNIASILRGDMTEGATRVPSALALIGMTLWCFGSLTRRKGAELGLLTALLLFTCMEIHKAATTCTVDMMLTATTVCAMYMLFRWHEHNMRDTASAVIAIVLMGAATLTKGPVGTLIPCMVMGVFMLLRGTGFFKAVLWLTLLALLSLIPYALWFYAAWLQGGQEFLDLVYAENIGRMVNAMGYEPHVQPWPYYLKTLLVGFQPWTLLFFVSLFFVRFNRHALSPSTWWSRLRHWLREGDAVNVFSLIAIVIIFVFYSIPQTKKPTYLLPIYPFLAYFLAKYILWMAENRRMVMRLYGGILSILIILLFIGFLTVHFGFVPEDIFTGSGASFYIDTMHTLQEVGPWWQWAILITSALFGIYWWIRHKDDDMHNIYAVLFMTFGLWVAVDAVYRPAVLNSRSVRTTSILINHAVPASAGPLYEFIERSVNERGDYVHFFEVNFYLRNRIKNFDRQHPDKGFLLITKTDAQRNLPVFEREGYQFKLCYEAERREMQIYAFNRTSAKTAN